MASEFIPNGETFRKIEDGIYVRCRACARPAEYAVVDGVKTRMHCVCKKMHTDSFRQPKRSADNDNYVKDGLFSAGLAAGFNMNRMDT